MDVCVGFKALGATTETRKSPETYHVTLAISVDDIGALWAAAAEICVRDAGLSPDEVDETIGPREDPSIRDCLTMVTLPTRVAGCQIVDFSIAAVEAAIGAHQRDAVHSTCHPVRAASLRPAVASN